MENLFDEPFALLCIVVALPLSYEHNSQIIPLPKVQVPDLQKLRQCFRLSLCSADSGLHLPYSVSPKANRFEIWSIPSALFTPIFLETLGCSPDTGKASTAEIPR